MKRYVAVLAALRRESSGLRPSLRRLQRISFEHGSVLSGECRGQPVLLGHSGIGPARAAALTKGLIQQFPLRAVLSVGFAGALRPEMKVGEIVLADRVLYDKRCFLCDERLFKLGERVLRRTRLPNSAGSLISVDEIVGLPDQKRNLSGRGAAIALDMESGAVAETASLSSLPYLAVRAVSDSSDDPLDSWLGKVVAPRGGIRYGALLAKILARPERILVVNRLRRQTLSASGNLGRFLVDLLAEPPDCWPD